MTRKTRFSKIAEDLSQITPTETLEVTKSNKPRKLKDIIADLEAE